MGKMRKICPVAPSQLSHMPHIWISISRNLLIILLLQRHNSIKWKYNESNKGSFMGLHQIDVPTGTVKMRSTIVYNLIHHIDGNSLGSIITWFSEVILWITHSNYSISISPESWGRIHMNKPCLVVTGIFCPSYLIKFPVIYWNVLNQSYGVRGTSFSLPHQ